MFVYNNRKTWIYKLLISFDLTRSEITQFIIETESGRVVRSTKHCILLMRDGIKQN